MESYIDTLKYFRSTQAAKDFGELYGVRDGRLVYEIDRYSRIVRRFAEKFGEDRQLRFFSAPGRTEIVGNHTDHNAGRVLAAAINLDAIACVSPNEDGVIRFCSEGYDRIDVDLDRLEMRPEESGTTAGLVRGMACAMKEHGYEIGGFDATATSNVLVGSGLSSSASIEVLLCAIFDGLYNGMRVPAEERARIAQWVENNYFGKPCGLMDQMASSVGGLTSIDFYGRTKVRAMAYDFERKGVSLVVVNTGGSHDDLIDAYAAIPTEMRLVAKALGGKVLRDVLPEQLYDGLPKLYGVVSDRAILRAMHYFDENQRVDDAVDALKRDDIEAFFEAIIASGESSWRLLQNAYMPGDHQPLSVALAMSQRMLKGKGAWRVHGGGFAGTVLAFVPHDLLAEYVRTMDGVYGDRACTVLGIRPVGAAELVVKEHEA